LTQEATNTKLRKLIAESSMEFIEFMKDKDNFVLNERHNKKQVFDAFVEEYNDFKKWLTRKKFNIWVKKYADYNELKFDEGNTSGNRWFILESNEDEIIEETETPF